MNRIRWIAAAMTPLFAGPATPCGAAERPSVVREALTVESSKLVRNKHTKRAESVRQVVPVAVYRPNDGAKHPAIVYLHGGGMSFADPLMERFHVELAARGLVVLAPHYLLDRTGWQQWRETAEKTVTLATQLPGVDADHIGMSGLSMGGQVGLSTAARDPRIKAVAEYFTAWPGSLPDEPIAKLPPVLLLNGTADPIIPFDVAMVLDKILEQHKLPFERHVYEGLGHGFATPASFKDGLRRTAAFFGGRVDEPAAAVRVEPVGGPEDLGEPSATLVDLDDEEDLANWPTATILVVPAAPRKPSRLVVKKPAEKVARP